MKLYVGAAKADITPTEPVPLAGFAVRGNKPFERIESDIYVKVLFFRQKDADGTVRQAVVAAADLIWWGSDRMAGIRERLKARWGLGPERIVLNATHSHSGPQTCSTFHRMLGRANSAYVAFLEERLLEAIDSAAGNLEPVSIERGTGESRIGVQRRRYADGKVYGGPNPNGPMDPEVNVVRFRTEDGRTKALIVHYACHPITSTENEVSAEFAGYATERLEREHEGSVCLYLQGCCGDIAISKSSAPSEAATDREKMAYFGEKLADTVSDVLASSMKPLASCALRGLYRTVPLKLLPLPDRERLAAVAAAGEPPYDEWASYMLERYDERPAALGMEMTRLDVADGLTLLTMNAEVVVDYGLYMKRLSAGNVLPVAYTNGMIGYVPTAEQHPYRGYESDLSTYYFHMPSRLDPASDRDFRAALADMIRPQSGEGSV
ncbi:neutral/alkaline non-lysosomal ceramidase N-terminal domain-containing protein [Paenibacillus sp. GYB003]|uniref:neutral/alkaline non-lysosomal ceramidase N-terminal domain-containing protein n=1 Tax=Paenibacillus sp. GYB003 TaxID=2994392 RepID=UPI002F9697A7